MSAINVTRRFDRIKKSSLWKILYEQISAKENFLLTKVICIIPNQNIFAILEKHIPYISYRTCVMDKYVMSCRSRWAQQNRLIIRTTMNIRLLQKISFWLRFSFKHGKCRFSSKYKSRIKKLTHSNEKDTTRSVI